jgi:glycosyltransferase involved in cell wall biosynthesis
MPTNIPPLVSICIPTYRGAHYLGSAIQSVLNQSFTDFELLILDDNSPDCTPEVVARYDDPRIHYFRNHSNLGPEGNWNLGVKLAKGTYFKLLPHDDVLMPDCLESQVKILEADDNQQISLVFGCRQIIDAQGNVLMARGPGRERTGLINGKRLVQRCIRAGTNLIGEPGAGLCRRETMGKVGFYDARFAFVVDLDYWFRLLQHGDAYYTGTLCSAFRVSEGSWSVALGRKQIADFRNFAIHYNEKHPLNISSVDLRVGVCRAHVNTTMRILIYFGLRIQNYARRCISLHSATIKYKSLLDNIRY